MQKADRAVLRYMQHRHWIALGAILTECPEATEQVLESLVRRELLDYEKYFGEGNTQFYRPNAATRRTLLPWCSNMIDFIAQNWIALSGIILGLAAVIIGTLSLK